MFVCLSEVHKSILRFKYRPGVGDVICEDKPDCQEEGEGSVPAFCPVSNTLTPV